MSPLPDELLEISKWHRCVVGAWKRNDKIHNKDCRAAILGLRRTAREGHDAGDELLSVRDNLSEILAIEKGRAKDWALNTLCRRPAALQLGADISWKRRHVESLRNVSDFDSRLADRGLLEA
eukprot:11538292-Karenia_brevis.AAC.1